MAPSSISKRTSSPSPTRDMQSPTARNSGINQTGSSVKLKKVERKAKEQIVATLQDLSVRIGKLEDRDTQQQAFQSLVQSLPQLSPSLVSEFYTLIEKNKKPSRSSTRRMLVLLLSVLCKCHPLPSTKLLPRITTYISTRLRDNEAKVTEACEILVSSIALHVIPYCGLTLDKVDRAKPTSVENSGLLDKWSHVFESISAPLARDANAIGENATKCLCALLRPTEFDGQTPPSKDNLVAHATRVLPFFRMIVGASVSKMNGSTVYASFSSHFLLLKAACEIASDAHARAGLKELSDAFVPHVGFVVEAIEDVFQYGPRDDWTLRMRGMELLTLLIEGFGLSEEDESAASAIEYFRVNLERVRSLVLAGRQDLVSSVREAAIQTVIAFEKLNKRYGGQSPVKGTAVAYHQQLSEPYRSKEPSAQPDWKASARELAKEEDNKLSNTVPEAKPDASSEEQEFDEIGMDEAAAPDLQQHLADDQEQESSTLAAKLQAAAPTSSSLQQFVTKKREQTAKLLKQHQQRSPRISPPKEFSSRKSVDEFEFPPDIGDMSESGPHKEEEDNRLSSTNDTSGADGEPDADENDELASMSRAEAALSAAQCHEYDLSLRLCLLEDDLPLLKQVMGVIGAPCMNQLSRSSRSALCAAFLEMLEDPGGSDDSGLDQWLVFAWLRDLSRRQAGNLMKQIDPRVLRALEQRLEELSVQPTKAGLEAAGVLEQL